MLLNLVSKILITNLILSHMLSQCESTAKAIISYVWRLNVKVNASTIIDFFQSQLKWPGLVITIHSLNKWKDPNNVKIVPGKIYNCSLFHLKPHYSSSSECKLFLLE